MSIDMRIKIASIRKKIIVSFLLVCVFSVTAHASNFYVRKGAFGNGSSWSNAWNDINNISNIREGDTVYLAAGNYTGRYKADSSGWTLKRATLSEHGSDIGWSAEYAGTVTITNSTGDTFTLNEKTNITIDGVDRAYFILNGSNGGSYGVHATGGYNLKIKNATIHNYLRAGIRFYQTTGGIEVSGSEIYKTGFNGAEDTDGVIVINNCSGEHGNNVIANNYLHDPGINENGVNLDTIPSSGTSFLFIYNNTFEPGWHRDGSADLISIRSGTDRYIYNNFFKLGKYNRNQNIFISASNGNVSNTYIYNNLFFQDPTTLNDGPAQPIMIAWFGVGGYNNHLYGLYIYNNTFYGQVYNIYGQSDANYIHDIVIKNNTFNAIWPSGELYIIGFESKMTVDYNFYYQSADGYVGTLGGANRTLSDVRKLYGWEANGGEGNPQFQSIQKIDFRLSPLSPEKVRSMGQSYPGKDLFDYDKSGLKRNIGGWSMGAYQYDKQESNLAPPTNIKVIK